MDNTIINFQQFSKVNQNNFYIFLLCLVVSGPLEKEILIDCVTIIGNVFSNDNNQTIIIAGFSGKANLAFSFLKQIGEPITIKPSKS